MCYILAIAEDTSYPLDCRRRLQYELPAERAWIFRAFCRRAETRRSQSRQYGRVATQPGGKGLEHMATRGGSQLTGHHLAQRTAEETQRACQGEQENKRRQEQRGELSRSLSRSASGTICTIRLYIILKLTSSAFRMIYRARRGWAPLGTVITIWLRLLSIDRNPFRSGPTRSRTP